MVALGISNLCFMLPWQFAQFVLLTQVNREQEKQRLERERRWEGRRGGREIREKIETWRELRRDITGAGWYCKERKGQGNIEWESVGWSLIEKLKKKMG